MRIAIGLFHTVSVHFRIFLIYFIFICLSFTYMFHLFELQKHAPPPLPPTHSKKNKTKKNCGFGEKKMCGFDAVSMDKTFFGTDL